MNKEGWFGKDVWAELQQNLALYPPELLALGYFQEFTKRIQWKGLKLIEFGCGTGRYGLFVQERGGIVLSTDISDNLLDEASKHLDTEVADITDLRKYHGADYDCALSMMVFHTLTDPQLEQALSEVSKVINPETGRYIISIIYPGVEKFATKTGKMVRDMSTYHRTERRDWVFNLTDGRRIPLGYIHRPWEKYKHMITKHFIIERIYVPELDQRIQEMYPGFYPKREFLFVECAPKSLTSPPPIHRSEAPLLCHPHPRQFLT